MRGHTSGVVRVLVWVVCAACGSGSSSGPPGDDDRDAPPRGDDAAMTIDAQRFDAHPVVDASPAPYCTPKSGTRLKLTPVVTGVSEPLFVTAPPGDERLFIVQRGGSIRIFKNKALLPTPYLTVDLPVSNNNGDEQGLLGMAFHPDYAKNGRFFVSYTTGSHVSVAEYGADPSKDIAGTTGRVLLSVPHIRDNHNGGMLQFGPDGYLYISFGDGGGANNSEDNAQTPTSLLGKILRIDVDEGKPYGIPADNPWKNGGGVPEMWAWGLRNPWRFSIDLATGNLFIGDVGQTVWEEVNVMPGGERGFNFGWPICEGQHTFVAGGEHDTGVACPAASRGIVNAHFAFNQDDTVDSENPCAVIGGFVYRGTCMPDMGGRYFFGDKCTGRVKSFAFEEGKAPTPTDHSSDLASTTLLAQQLSSFGTDSHGELYVTELKGTVYRIEAR